MCRAPEFRDENSAKKFLGTARATAASRRVSGPRNFERFYIAEIFQMLGRGYLVYGRRLQYELRRGDERVVRLRAFQPFRRLCSLPRENEAHVHLR